jgi:hypothetical protein
VLAAALVVAAIGAGAVYGARQVYFLGTDEGGRVALYRGLPYDLPFGIELYSEVYSAPVTLASVPEDRRDSVTEHELRSRDDAESLLTDIEAAATEAAEEPTVEQPRGQQGQQGRNQQQRQGGRDGGGGQNAGGQNRPSNR